MSMSRREMELRIKELFDAEEILIKRITALESLLRECADDIAAYVDAEYPIELREQYPDYYLPKYLRDTEIVVRARDLLAGPALEPEPRDGRSVAAELAHTFTGIMRELVDSAVLAKPPYPMCRTPIECAGKGYCPKDPACNN